MNLSGKSEDEILFINFNQDYSCISVGTQHGYKIYNCDPFGRCFAKANGGIGIVEMLFCTSLVALVGAGEKPAFSRRHLQIINTKRGTMICEIPFPDSILAVKLNRRRLVVVLETAIYIYDIANMKCLHSIETSPNPNAICALSPNTDNCYVAYPSQTPPPSSPFSKSTQHTPSGDVLIFDASSLMVVNMVQAHKSPLAYVSINTAGDMLATASDKGTVVRVFSIPDSHKLYQFRRGSYHRRIHSISFNSKSTLLCVSSDTDTVHVFKLEEKGAANNNATNGGSSTNGNNNANTGALTRQSMGSAPIGGYEGYIDGIKKTGSVRSSSIRRQSYHHITRTVAGSVGNYLPDALTEIWEPSRDFAYLKLPNPNVQSVVALSSSTPQVMVVTSEGYFYQYNIDFDRGGECTLQRTHSLLEPLEPDDQNTNPLD